MTAAYLPLQNLINGACVPARSERCLPVQEPATGNVYATAPDCGAADVDNAIAAAVRAAPEWARTSPAQRALALQHIADAVQARFEEFAQAESRDTGKPISVARRVDIPRAIANLRFFAASAETFASESHAQAGQINYTLRQPLGVVACISPWNLPLYLLTWKIAPALAAGNAVVAKPSEVTPYTAHLLGEVVRDSSLPPGVLNLLHGTGAGCGAALVAHRDVKAISFTGSTATGRAIAQSTAAQFKKLSLEMGGKNATVVFADADFELAVSESVRAAFSNSGQICLCGSRVLVERSLYPRFREAFVARARALQVGDPSAPETELGALVSQQHLQKVLGCVALAHEEGGRLLTGGARQVIAGRCEQGYFLPPTVFDQLPPNCRTNVEEIFGPVVTLAPFDNEAQALLYANTSDYGLACTVFTSDLSRAHRFAGAVQSGLVWVNCWMQRDLRVPFGGVKNSGVGREGGWEAMRFFSEAKNVCIAF